jgi:hypothetical protein
MILHYEPLHLTRFVKKEKQVYNQSITFPFLSKVITR